MKRNTALRVAALLLCLVLASGCLLSGMLAKYTLEGTSQDRARVAKFGTLTLTETTGTTYSILPGAAITKNPKVTMAASEVAVRVYVTIEAEGWNQDGTKFYYYNMSEEGEEPSYFLSFAVAGEWTQDRDGTFYRDVAPGDRLEDVSILAGDAITVSPEISYIDYYNLDESILNIEISARAEQLD